MEKCAIVVGGTGMLKDVTLWLSGQGYKVFVIGRNEGILENMAKVGESGTIIPISVDYHDDHRFRAKIAEINEANGPIELVVSWIHSSAPRAFDILTDEVSNKTEGHWRLFHVRGSTASLSKTPVPVPDNCLYNQILLGFVIDNGQSRWLTHKEISNGVIHAIKNDLNHSVVGTIEPWEKRP